MDTDRLAFPSLAWFEALATQAGAHRALFEHLGYVDCIARFVVTEVPGGPFAVDVTFDEFDITAVEAADMADTGRPDFTMTAGIADWQAMLESVSAGHGRPGLDQTLNYLTLTGTPFHISGEDSNRREAFLRYAQSMQELFNLSWHLRSVFPEPVEG